MDEFNNLGHKVNLRVNQPLKDDFNFLLSAKSLVGGRGTFVPIIASMSNNISSLYLWDSNNQGLGLNIKNLYLLKDKTGRYTERCLAENWENSQIQRSLMINYEINDIYFSHIKKH